MITCKIGDKKYTVDYITGRALREMEPAVKMAAQLRTAAKAADDDGQTPSSLPSAGEAMDVMVKWFCVLFGNQFTPDEVYDLYPSDSLIYDITYAMLAVQNSATSVLKEFPIRAAREDDPPTAES